MFGVYDFLESDVGTGLYLETTPRRVSIEFVGQRPLDVPRPGVVPLDQIGVIAVRDPHQARQAGGGTRMQAGTDLARGGWQLCQ